MKPETQLLITFYLLSFANGAVFGLTWLSFNVWCVLSSMFVFMVFYKRTK